MASWSNVAMFTLTILLTSARICNDLEGRMGKFEKICYEETSANNVRIPIASKTALQVTLTSCGEHFLVLSPPRKMTVANVNILMMTLLLCCGDVESDPGPRSTYTPKHPCTSCSKGVTSRSKAISCDMCDNWTHVKCSDSITIAAYNNAVETDAVLNFTCNKCQLLQLPSSPDIFNESSASNESSADLTEPVVDEDVFIPFKTKGLHLIHANARSLRHKIPELNIIIQRTNASVVAVTETWLDDSITNAEIAIEGYSIQRNDRNTIGGGVCLYIRNNLSFNRREDLHDPNLEATWIDLFLRKTQPILIGCIY